jgi:prepilin-type processing-associated H-X9-DG protein
MPEVYGCPDDPDAAYGETSYMVIRGPGAFFEADKQTRTQDVTDGLSNTILVVESIGSGTSWTAPVDLDFRDMPLTVNAERGGSVRSAHASGGANVLMADGATYVIPDHLSPDVLQALITVNGGEAIWPAEHLR